MVNSHHKKAFTLAEVLITLSIIGVIAALTIPQYLQSTHKHELRSALKKAISSLNQALELHYSLTGLTAHDYETSEDIVENLFLKRMQIGENDTDFTSEICDGRVFSTADGTLYCISNFSSDPADKNNSLCNSAGTVACVKEDSANIWIDVNGSRKPNLVTINSHNPKDIYQAQLYSNKVVPFGIPTKEVMFDTEFTENNNKDNEDKDNTDDKGDSGDTGDTGNQGGEEPGGNQGGDQGGDSGFEGDLGDNEDLRPWIDDYYDEDQWGNNRNAFLEWLRALLKFLGIIH